MYLEEFTIILKSEDEILSKGLILRELTVRNKENIEKTIIQLQVICWPDHDVPDINIGNTTIEIIISYVDEYRKKYPDSPVVIHCR